MQYISTWVSLVKQLHGCVFSPPIWEMEHCFRYKPVFSSSKSNCHRGITRLFYPIILFIVALNWKMNQCQDLQGSGLLSSEVVCSFVSHLYHITCCQASVINKVEFVHSNSFQFILGQDCLKQHVLPNP